MNKNDLIAALYDAKAELNVLASYLDDPATPWPNYGLKATAQAHKRMRDRINALLMLDESEDIPLRQENLALRAALRSQAYDEEWRFLYLEAKQEAAAAKVEIQKLKDALIMSQGEAEMLRGVGCGEWTELDNERVQRDYCGVCIKCAARGTLVPQKDV